MILLGTGRQPLRMTALGHRNGTFEEPMELFKDIQPQEYLTRWSHKVRKRAPGSVKGLH